MGGPIPGGSGDDEVEPDQETDEGRLLSLNKSLVENYRKVLNERNELAGRVNEADNLRQRVEDLEKVNEEEKVNSEELTNKLQNISNEKEKLKDLMANTVAENVKLAEENSKL